MNWNKLQEMQLALDNAILQAKPQMTAEERFNKTLVALSVEVAEVANCAEHFKFWKDNKGKVDEKRFITTIDFMFEDGVRNDKRKHELLKDTSHLLVDSSKKYNLDNYELLTIEQAHKLTLVEECSDVLHFLLSIANQLDYELDELLALNSDYQKEYLYLKLNYYISACYNNYSRGSLGFCQTNLRKIMFYYMSYVNSLGITTQELEQAYYEKNEENYRRLREGY